MEKKRRRDCLIKFYVTDKENELIELKMQQLGTSNKSAYLRKIAIDGYVVKQDFENLRGMIFELNKIGVNVNQIAKVANTYGAGQIFESDIIQIRKDIKNIWQRLASMV